MLRRSVLNHSISSSRPGSPKRIFCMGGQASITASSYPVSSKRSFMRAMGARSHGRSPAPTSLGRVPTAWVTPACLARLQSRSGCDMKYSAILIIPVQLQSLSFERSSFHMSVGSK